MARDTSIVTLSKTDVVWNDSVRDSNHVRDSKIWGNGFCNQGDRNKRRGNRVHCDREANVKL